MALTGGVCPDSPMHLLSRLKLKETRPLLFDLEHDVFLLIFHEDFHHLVI